MDNIQGQIRRPGDDLLVSVAPGRRALTLEIKEIVRAESRLHEVQLVSHTRSGELLNLYNQACLDCKKHVNSLTSEKNYAERYAAKIRSEAIFNRLPDFLKEKGLAKASSPIGSEDVRETFLATDEAYQSALDLATEIDAAIGFFEIRYKAFERAFYATHKLTDSRPPPGMNAYSAD